MKKSISDRSTFLWIQATRIVFNKMWFFIIIIIPLITSVPTLQCLSFIKYKASSDPQLM